METKVVNSAVNEAKTQTQTTTNTEEKAAERKPASIEFIEHDEFKGQARCLYTSTIQLADTVGGIFAPAFKDYSGCKILINTGRNASIIQNTIPVGGLYVDLYFKQGAGNPNAPITNLELRSSKIENDLGARLTHVIGGGSCNRYIVSDKTKEILTAFIPNKNNPRWNDRIFEHTVRQDVYNTREEIVVRISGLSLDLLISAIYGNDVETTDEDGIVSTAHYEYNIVPIRQVLNSVDEYVLQITQMDKRIVNDLQRVLGFTFQTPANYNIYRG